jgi:nitrile hydratase accessory protein
MTMPESSLDAALGELPGQAAVPRRNGEPVFDAPWQSRAFGMVASLHAQSAFPWSSFKDLLIEQIARDAHDDGSASSYYDHWVAAFERLVVDRQIVPAETLAMRADEFLSGARRDLA